METADMGFSDQLRKENQRIWDAILEHPFVTELGAGTLPLEKFTYYIKQDYQYLIDFARCIGLATSKAEDVEDMRSWAEMMGGCLRYETEMLESLSRALGMPPGEISQTPKAPTNEAYTNHILKVAYEGSMCENVAALLPCMWAYMDVGDVFASALADIDVGGETAPEGGGPAASSESAPEVGEGAGEEDEPTEALSAEATPVAAAEEAEPEASAEEVEPEASAEEVEPEASAEEVEPGASGEEPAPAEDAPAAVGAADEEGAAEDAKGAAPAGQ